MKKPGLLNSLERLYALFGHLIPDSFLKPSDEGKNSRERLFSVQVTFWTPQKTTL